MHKLENIIAIARKSKESITGLEENQTVHEHHHYHKLFATVSYTTQKLIESIAFPVRDFCCRRGGKWDTSSATKKKSLVNIAGLPALNLDTCWPACGMSVEKRKATR